MQAAALAAATAAATAGDGWVAAGRGRGAERSQRSGCAWGRASQTAPGAAAARVSLGASGCPLPAEALLGAGSAGEPPAPGPRRPVPAGTAAEGGPGSAKGVQPRRQGTAPSTALGALHPAGGAACWQRQPAPSAHCPMCAEMRPRQCSHRRKRTCKWQRASVCSWDAVSASAPAVTHASKRHRVLSWQMLTCRCLHSVEAHTAAIHERML